ncbi:MAG: right-handed parallel beta-helix repeat-containing protein [Bacteroidales bacterium]|nr:right-handed parallel beta-helix repeat-containing protein [Bacteroidales bacterium]
MKKFIILLMTVFIAMTSKALNHSGYINTETWYASGNPHIITNNLFVNSGHTLTIEAGCIIKFDGNYRFVVWGALHADGTDANHILFTSNEPLPAAGDWRYIHFQGAAAGTYMNYCDISYGGSQNNNASILLESNDGNVSLNYCVIEYSDDFGICENWNGSNISNCTIRYSDKSGIYVNGGATNISGCTIENNTDYGIYYNNDYTPATISNTSITNNGNYAILTYGNLVTNITGNMSISGNNPDAIRVEGNNNYLDSGTWLNHDVPYVVAGNIYVNNGQTLTLEAGVVIRFDGNRRLHSYGSLIADGTAAEPIIFTSFDSSPSAGDWRNVCIEGPESACLLDYCIIRYAGSSNDNASLSINSASNLVTISNCIVENGDDHGIRIRWDNTLVNINNTVVRNHKDDGISLDWGASVNLDGCNIENNGGYGIYCIGNEEIASVANTSVLNNGNYAIYTFADNVRFLQTTTTISGNNPDAVWVGYDNISTGTWNNLDAPYVIGENYITVPNNQVWTIEKGTIIKVDGNYEIDINGSVVAIGSVDTVITFTTNTSNKWKYLYLDGADAGTTFEYCNFLYGGRSNGTVYLNNSGTNVSFNNCRFEYSDNSGVYIYNSSPSFINCTLTHNDTYGIMLTGGNTPTFGTDTTEWNAIYGNSGPYQLRGYNVATTAEYIYWGNTNCIGQVDDLIHDDDETGWYAPVDFTPFISNSQIGFDVETTWTGDSDTDWDDDDNWDNCKPCAEINAVIPDDPRDQPVVGDDVETKDLTMLPGSTLDILSGNTLIVHGDLLLQADESSQASLIDAGTLTVLGETFAEFYVDADRWHYLSSPVSNAVSNVFLELYLKQWHENDSSWSYIVPVDVPLNPGQGYASWSYSGDQGTKTVAFTGGSLNTGTLNLPVTATDQGGNASIDNGEGWNYVGNPYPSAIDWDVAGWTKTNINGTIYVYDGVQYRTWNGHHGTLSGGIIPAMQGFMVKANDFNPVLQVSNATRRHGRSVYKSTNEVSNLLVLKVEGNGYSDETFIHFNENATNGFDNELDGYKLFGIDEAPQIYSKADGLKLSINDLPEMSEGLVIPVGLRVGAEGEYTLAVSGLEDVCPAMDIYLVDIKTGVNINLCEQQVNTFVSSPLDNYDRFYLHFGTLGTQEPVPHERIHIYSDENVVYVSNPENKKGLILEVVDITGHKVITGKLDSSSLTKTKLDVSGGYYIVKVSSDTEVVSKKVFIQ